jgi:hypothetical protein
MERSGGKYPAILASLDFALLAGAVVIPIFSKLGLTEENHLHRRVGAVLAFLRDDTAELKS